MSSRAGIEDHHNSETLTPGDPINMFLCVWLKRRKTVAKTLSRGSILSYVFSLFALPGGLTLHHTQKKFLPIDP